ncbi:MAG: PIN domain-containing protein [Deltaproteobacteria bacterium]|nr:PIN domain-containing protein [Deltaproteobacteria bacterium]
MSRAKIGIIDSNIYIDLFRYGFYKEELREINKNFIIRNSSVVLLELYTGALEIEEKKLITKMQRDLGIINPTPRNWIESGTILNGLIKRYGFGYRKIRDLVNDTLIAMSARSNGAAVITNNSDDFEIIRKFKHFNLIVL